LRARNAGERTAIGRLLIVLAAIVAAPALIVGFVVLGPVVGIGAGILTAIGGLIALVKWIAKGSAD